MLLKRYFRWFMPSCFAGLLLLESSHSQAAIKLFCLYVARGLFWFLRIFDPSITLSEAVLRHGSTGFALEVGAPCSALPQAWLLLCGLLAFPASLSARSRSILMGLLALQGLNSLRLIWVFYLLPYVSQDTLNFVHEKVFSWFFSVLLLLLFLVLLQGLRVTRPQATETG